jgi:hypothetical protein
MNADIDVVNIVAPPVGNHGRHPANPVGYSNPIARYRTRRVAL